MGSNSNENFLHHPCSCRLPRLHWLSSQQTDTDFIDEMMERFKFAVQADPSENVKKFIDIPKYEAFGDSGRYYAINWQGMFIGDVLRFADTNNDNRISA